MKIKFETGFYAEFPHSQEGIEKSKEDRLEEIRHWKEDLAFGLKVTIGSGSEARQKRINSRFFKRNDPRDAEEAIRAAFQFAGNVFSAEMAKEATKSIPVETSLHNVVEGLERSE